MSLTVHRGIYSLLLFLGGFIWPIAAVNGATIVVNNTNDSGPGSLRQALIDAANGDTIDATGISGTITLIGGTLSVTKSVTINGPGAVNLIIDGNYPNATNSVVTVTQTGPVVIDGITITNGQNSDGGGIYNDRSVLTLSNCVVTNNSTTFSGDFGAGIYNRGESGSATLTLINSTVSNNSGNEGGGIMNDGYSGNATMTIYNSTISGNSASVNGGGVYNNSYQGTANLVIANSTISGNSASYNGGGLIVNDQTTVAIYNSTITGNSSGSSGGGATIWANIVTFQNTIVADNTSPSGADISGAVTSSGYNLIGTSAGSSGWIQTDQLDIEPILGPLADNGGPTYTHALLPGSPAVNAGDPMFDPNAYNPPLSYDQRGAGFDRVQHGRVDIGAYESNLTSTPTPTPTVTPTPSPSATPSPTASVTPTPSATPPVVLRNISTRLSVGSDDKVLIGGFIIKGKTPKRLLLRAIGPSLSQFGLADILTDPVLELHKPDGTVVTNDDWQDSQEKEIKATGIAPTDSRESALLVTLDPADATAPGSGQYTAIVRGKDGKTGIGMVEAYDLDQLPGSQLVNISTRGLVGQGDNVMIGAVITGTAGQVLLRAIGPELAATGVTGALGDPVLELHDKDGNILATNDNWKDTQEREIEATSIPPTDDRESAILTTLTPDNYTAIVRGRNGTTGVALVEVYSLGP